MSKPAILIVLILSGIVAPGLGQVGRGGSNRSITVNVIVSGPKDAVVNKDMVEVYDGGVHQEVQSFDRVPSGSRVVLLVDNSMGLKIEPQVLQKAALAVINELYQDDQMLVVGYNKDAEIIQDMTGNLAKLQISAAKFTRKGFPRLFDALIAVSDAISKQPQSLDEKHAIVLLSDGYDSESQTRFEQVLYTLEDANIVVYAIQVPDRTHGALLRDKPKPSVVLEKLARGTGGMVYPVSDVEKAAKTITNELRNEWYRLVYIPTGVSTISDHRILVLSDRKEVQFRAQVSEPGRYRPPE